MNSDGRCPARGGRVVTTVLHFDDEQAWESGRPAWAVHGPRQAGVPR